MQEFEFVQEEDGCPFCHQSRRTARNILDYSHLTKKITTIKRGQKDRFIHSGCSLLPSIYRSWPPEKQNQEYED
jgi:hypothetical protein